MLNAPHRTRRPAHRPGPWPALLGAVLAVSLLTPASNAEPQTADSHLLGPPPAGHDHEAGELPLSDRFKRIEAPGTGRLAVQLTTGEGFKYPLYYFIPGITRDLRHLIYHSTENGTIQLYRLDLTTTETVRLTDGNTPQKGWWGSPGGTGVLDHRSVLNVARNQVIYFTGPEGRQVRMVDVVTLEDTALFNLPEGREAIAQNACTPDGNWFLYIHAPAEKEAEDPLTRVMAYNFDSGEQRLLHAGSHRYHHVTPYGNDRAFFCHKWQLVGLDGTPAVRMPVGLHAMVTDRGITSDGSSIYHPLTGKRIDIPTPRDWGYVHTGWDPAGQLWFWEARPKEGVRLAYLKRYDHTGHGQHVFEYLTGPWSNGSRGQRSHLHPLLSPDRRWMIFAADDPHAPEARSTQLYLLDVSDLRHTDVLADAVKANPAVVKGQPPRLQLPNNPPQAHFTVANHPGVLSITCDASATSDPDWWHTLTWTWDFGDGTTATGKTVSHVYAEPGSYLIQLQVADDHEGADTHQIQVNMTNDGYTDRLGSANSGILAQDDATGRGYLMYSVQDTHTRFADAPPHAESTDHMIVVKQIDGRWHYDTNDAYVPFTPAADDVLLFAVDFDTGKLTDLQGENRTEAGITCGYLAGDITARSGWWQGRPNGGEFGIGGHGFIRHQPADHPAPTPD